MHLSLIFLLKVFERNASKHARTQDRRVSLQTTHVVSAARLDSFFSFILKLTAQLSNNMLTAL